MATEDIKPTSAEPETPQELPKVPDYLASPNAVFGDKDVQWRYGRAPDYSKTRKVWAEGKTMNHAAGSLEEMVENLVKNWEVEASFKPRLSDWRTIDHEKYSFAMGGGPPMSAEHMIKVGTYNGIIAPNEYYSPENSDFASSHKTFKRMMPTFAWEVLEVYSGPPRVSFRWRHWGTMKSDYVGFNDKGEKVTAKAHGGIIDIEGVTVAEVDDKVRLRALQTWMDPLEMFRQIAPQGIVNKQTMNRKVDMETALDVDADRAAAQQTADSTTNGTPDITQQPAAISAEKSVPAEGGRQDDQSNGVSMGQTDQSSTTTQQMPSRTLTVGPTDTSLEQANSHAKSIVDSAATHGEDRTLEKPESNAQAETEVIPPSEWPNTKSAPATGQAEDEQVPRSIYSSSITGREEDVVIAAKLGNVEDESEATDTYDDVDRHLEGSAAQVHPHPKDTEKKVGPEAGEAVAAGSETEETRLTHEEMGTMTPGECPFLMNRE
ncbi:hypothetical protein CBER1_05349 [Cercospora berteroae]|uniref:Pathogen-related protein n=1 Tax=Cercospora berteroae TaxID=357750 RepID=A0A2S6CHM2_9PEZI|nr:hypothetical protein CBER1_05349 [Cercospora berteroae]